MFVSSPSEQRLVLGEDFMGNKPDVKISVFSPNHFRGDNPSNRVSGYVAFGCQCPLTEIPLKGLKTVVKLGRAFKKYYICSSTMWLPTSLKSMTSCWLLFIIILIIIVALLSNCTLLYPPLYTYQHLHGKRGWTESPKETFRYMMSWRDDSAFGGEAQLTHS